MAEFGFSKAFSDRYELGEKIGKGASCTAHAAVSPGGVLHPARVTVPAAARGPVSRWVHTHTHTHTHHIHTTCRWSGPAARQWRSRSCQNGLAQTASWTRPLQPACATRSTSPPTWGAGGAGRGRAAGLHRMAQHAESAWRHCFAPAPASQPSDPPAITPPPPPHTLRRSLNVCYFHGAYESEAAVLLVLERLSGGQLWDRWGRAGRQGASAAHAPCRLYAQGCGRPPGAAAAAAAAHRSSFHIPPRPWHAHLCPGPPRPAGCCRARTASGRLRALCGTWCAAQHRRAVLHRSRAMAQADGDTPTAPASPLQPMPPCCRPALSRTGAHDSAVPQQEHHDARHQASKRVCGWVEWCRGV